MECWTFSTDKYLMVYSVIMNSTNVKGYTSHFQQKCDIIFTWEFQWKFLIKCCRSCDLWKKKQNTMIFCFISIFTPGSNKKKISRNVIYFFLSFSTRFFQKNGLNFLLIIIFFSNEIVFPKCDKSIIYSSKIHVIC